MNSICPGDRRIPTRQPRIPTRRDDDRVERERASSAPSGEHIGEEMTEELAFQSEPPRVVRGVVRHGAVAICLTRCSLARHPCSVWIPPTGHFPPHPQARFPPRPDPPLVCSPPLLEHLPKAPCCSVAASCCVSSGPEAHAPPFRPAQLSRIRLNVSRTTLFRRGGPNGYASLGTDH